MAVLERLLINFIEITDWLHLVNSFFLEMRFEGGTLFEGGLSLMSVIVRRSGVKRG